MGSNMECTSSTNTSLPEKKAHHRDTAYMCEASWQQVNWNMNIAYESKGKVRFLYTYTCSGLVTQSKNIRATFYWLWHFFSIGKHQLMIFYIVKQPGNWAFCLTVLNTNGFIFSVVPWRVNGSPNSICSIQEMSSQFWCPLSGPVTTFSYMVMLGHISPLSTVIRSSRKSNIQNSVQKIYIFTTCDYTMWGITTRYLSKNYFRDMLLV